MRVISESSLRLASCVLRLCGSGQFQREGPNGRTSQARAATPYSSASRMSGSRVQVGARERLPVDRPAVRAQRLVHLDRLALDPRVGQLAGALDGDVGDLGVVEQRVPELVALAMMLGPVGQEQALVVPAGEAHQAPAGERRPVLVDHGGLEQLGLGHEVHGQVAELERHHVAAVLAQTVDVGQRIGQKPHQLDNTVVARSAGGAAPPVRPRHPRAWCLCSFGQATSAVARQAVLKARSRA